MSTWIDSHCHVQEHFFDETNETSGIDALRNAASNGVTGVVCVGTDEATSREAVNLARQVTKGLLGEGLPQMKAVVGLHPHDASTTWDWITGLVDEDPAAVAGIGECGLDYFYEHSPKPAQREAFVAQIHLAHRYELPLVIHARDAWADLFAILDSEGVPESTVLHCFTGGPSDAQACVERGLSVSFSGIVTFPKAEETRAAVKEVPLDRLLVETDSPFLAPVPHRGKTNEPAMVSFVGEAVAVEYGREVEEIAQATSANARRLFGLE